MSVDPSLLQEARRLLQEGRRQAANARRDSLERKRAEAQLGLASLVLETAMFGPEGLTAAATTQADRNEALDALVAAANAAYSPRSTTRRLILEQVELLRDKFSRPPETDAEIIARWTKDIDDGERSREAFRAEVARLTAGL